jgi:hypothetical protein
MGLPNQDEVMGKYEKAVGTVKKKSVTRSMIKSWSVRAPPNATPATLAKRLGRSSARSAR